MSGWNQLHRACFENNRGKVKTLVAAKTLHIDETTQQGWTALMIACQRGDYPRIVNILLANAANLSLVNERRATALIISSQHGRLKATKLLIDAGADTEATDDHGNTPLHMAGEQGHAEVTNLLIDAGADLEASDKHGNTPLHMATKQGLVEVMSALVEAGAGPNCQRDDGKTPLHLAAIGGTVGVVETLLDNGADSSIGELQDTVPLDLAACHKNVDVVRCLLRRDGLAKCGGETAGGIALRSSAGRGNTEVMEALIAGGVKDLGPALSLAITNRQEDCVKLLLRQRENISYKYINNSVDRLGRTPLMCAITQPQVAPALRFARWLMDAGADTALRVRVTDDEGTAFSKNITALECVDAVQSMSGSEDLPRVNAIRRLLLQNEAVHAVSWLWGKKVGVAAAVKPVHRLTTQPRMRRGSAATSRVLLSALGRYNKKKED